MAELSKITLPNGQQYDLKVYTDHIKPYIHKEYTGTNYYATAANQLQSTWYFMSVKPQTWNKVWRISFKLHTWCPSYPAQNSITFSTISGRQNGFTYMNFNDTDSTGHYYITCYPLTSAGFNAGYGHAIGMSIFYASNYTNSAHYRSFEVDLIQIENCEVTFLDTPVKWDSWTGTGTTNYGTLSNLNGASRGLQETGDSNDVNYQNRIYYGRFKNYAPSYRYVIFLQKDDQYLLPVNSVNNDPTNTSKAITTQSFDPFGYIFYWASTTNYATAGTQIGDAALYNQYNSLDLRYSFNTASTLVSRDPIYLVADIQSDGSAKFASNPIAKALPTTQDGHIYIFLGKAINSSSIELYPYHPIYWYKGGRVRYFTKSDLNNNGALWQYNSSTDSVELIFPN